ncbi:MAG: site-specific integrase [Prevotella sp.]|nr:site-specific integrase [Prevotella sp.]
MSKKINFSYAEVINQIKGWTHPTFHEGKETFVSFAAFDPISGKMKRKKIMLGHIKGKRAQRRYAEDVIRRLTEKLFQGWNPWVEMSAPKEYAELTDVFDKYKAYLFKMTEDGDMREETLTSYMSYMKIFSRWVEDERLTYIFQIDRMRISSFLDYVFIDRGCSLQTRNNYLSWLKVFSAWLLSHGFLTQNPCEGIRLTQRRNKSKNRTVIPKEDLMRLQRFLYETNKHYLLACCMLYYMFVRPHELISIRIRDIAVSGPTLFLHGENTKNGNDAVLTIPKRVLELMIELGVLSRPVDEFLFSRDFMPGREKRSEKMFRDYWLSKVSKSLGFPPEYKFYSLKDSGITNMLRSKIDVLTVRDQARHSSISITDMYTPKDVREANREVLDFEGDL